MLLISVQTNSLQYSPSIQGLDPSVGVIQVALSLYEREVGLMPDQISYTGKILQMEEVTYAHYFGRGSSSSCIQK